MRLLLLILAALISFWATRPLAPAFSAAELSAAEQAELEEAMQGPAIRCIAAETASGCADLQNPLAVHPAASPPASAS